MLAHATMCIRLCPAGDPESAPSGAAELDAFWSLRKASKTHIYWVVERRLPEVAKGKR